MAGIDASRYHLSSAQHCRIGTCLGGLDRSLRFCYLFCCRIFIVSSCRSQLFEFFLPILFVGLLVLIKMAVENSDSFAPVFVEPVFPTGNDAIKFFSFTDYVTTFQADRKCTVNYNAVGSPDGFGVTGISEQGYNWQVPFVKCDSRMCREDGQDALPFCEFLALGVAPSTTDDILGLEQANAFRDYIYDRYPVLLDPEAMRFSFPFVRMFGSNVEMENYVTSPEYSGPDDPKLGLGVIFDGVSDPTINYNYQIRVNSTGYNSPESEGRPVTTTTPPTDQLFQSLARDDDETCPDLVGGTPDMGPFTTSCTGQYIYNGALTIQRLVHDFILKDTGASDNGYFVADHGVQFVSFPTDAYTESGFYETISGFAPLLITLVRNWCDLFMEDGNFSWKEPTPKIPTFDCLTH